MRFGLQVDEQLAEAADVPLDEVGVQPCVLRRSRRVRVSDEAQREREREQSDAPSRALEEP